MLLNFGAGSRNSLLHVKKIGKNLARQLSVAVLLATAPFQPSGQSSNTDEIKEVHIAAGQSADLWMGINVKGRVFYAVRSKDLKNEVHMWWVEQPLGRVRRLGIRANSGSIDVPSYRDGAISAKLRAKATQDTVVFIRENIAVDSTVTFHWP
jgi:hypothetical protein